MFKTQKDDIASRPISRGPVSKKPKIDSRQDNSDDNSNLDGDDEHGSLFCTSRYNSLINFSGRQKILHSNLMSYLPIRCLIFSFYA